MASHKAGGDGASANDRKMEQVVEKRDAAEHEQGPASPGKGRPLEPRQSQQRRSESHQQKKDRGRILGAIQKGENREQIVGLPLPGFRIAIDPCGAQQDESGDRGKTEPDQKTPPPFGLPKKHFAQGIAACQHSNPRKQRVTDVEADKTRQGELSHPMERRPQPVGGAQVHSVHGIQQVVAHEQHNTNNRNPITFGRTT